MKKRIEFPHAELCQDVYRQTNRVVLEFEVTSANFEPINEIIKDVTGLDHGDLEEIDDLINKLMFLRYLSETVIHNPNIPEDENGRSKRPV